MILRYTLLYSVFLFFAVLSFGQTQKDTLYAVKSFVPVDIDGSDSDECWSRADWHPIDQVWIPYAAKMAAGDFEGKFKLAWDQDYLYVLVWVIDDMISDDHPDPLQNWWDDDCVEVFLDENRSKGNHQFNNNAFAYHISTRYDAIDLDSKGNGVNYKNNIEVVMDTIAANTYLWEIAIKVYDANFKLSDPEASRVYLNAGKLMGFTIAYCDNDKTTSRENFIGSMYMTAATANDNYITADYFGSLLLVESSNPTTRLQNQEKSSGIISVFPNPSVGGLSISRCDIGDGTLQLEIYSISGQILRKLEMKSSIQSVRVDDLAAGVYFVRASSERFTQIEKFVLRKN